ncbi:MAG TPA: M23 family metallopeptidase [Verrucomicrobiae bacterium]|nr:M23 family metallopeptidase [Verrucomicrobiae bacterium]
MAAITFLLGYVGAQAVEQNSSSANASGSLGNGQSRQMVRLTQRRDGDSIHFWAENLEAADVTATFGLSLVNLRGSRGFPLTMTLAPHQRIEAFTLRPIDAGREWRFNITNAYTLGSSLAVHDDSYAYSLPFAAGQAFQVTQADDGPFSHSGAERHAIDWKMPEGTPVFAARSGIVVGTKDDSDTGGPERRFETCANYILIEHSDGTIANYAHLLKHGVKVRLGEKVDVGTAIGQSGNTGFSSGPHLHLSVFKTLNGRDRESIPIRFQTAHGVERLVSGESYAAPVTRLAARGMGFDAPRTRKGATVTDGTRLDGKSQELPLVHQ